MKPLVAAVSVLVALAAGGLAHAQQDWRTPEVTALRARAEAGDAKVIAELRTLADGGDAAAQVQLGFMYAEGLGVAQDYLEAVRWTRLAVEQGNPRAQNNLGASYAFGFGVPQDDAEAVRCYRLSAEQRQECTFQIELREMGIWSHS